MRRYFLLCSIIGILIATNSMAKEMYSDTYRSGAGDGLTGIKYHLPPLDGENMVIITGTKYKEAANRLARWKNQIGIFTTVYEYPSTEVGSSLEDLRKFLGEKYDAGIAYFLLVGDREDIPTNSFKGFVGDGGSDPSLMFLEGGDYFLDAYIGRLSVETSAQASIVVNKIIRYEREPDASASWYKKALVFGSANILGAVSKNILAGTYTSAGGGDVSKSITEGRGTVFYAGHGTPEKWVTSGFNRDDVKKLRNSNKLPVIFSMACQNGYFGGGTCFAEEWLRAGTDSVGYGAVMFLGSTISLAIGGPEPALVEMSKVLAKNKSISVASIVVAGKNKMSHYSTYTTGPYKSWTIFGDPSMMVFSDTPKKLDVTIPANIDGDNSNLTITVADSIIGRVGVYSPQRDTLIASAIFNNETKKEFLLKDLLATDIDSLLVTVTGINRVPFIGKVRVASTAISHLKAVTDRLKSSIKLSISNNKLALSVPVDGIYNVNIYSVNGKLISRFTSTLNSGMNTISLDNNFVANSCVVLKISSEELTVTRKCIIK